MREIVRIDPRQANRAATWLASELGVSVQAVNNWKSRGIPARQHPQIAKALGWTLEQLHGTQPPASDPWPFETVAIERFARLSEREKGMVEAAMLDALERIEFASKPRVGPLR